MTQYYRVGRNNHDARLLTRGVFVHLEISGMKCLVVLVRNAIFILSINRRFTMIFFINDTITTFTHVLWNFQIVNRILLRWVTALNFLHFVIYYIRIEGKTTFWNFLEHSLVHVSIQIL